MTRYTASRIIDTSRDRLFDLVADVERYPEFLTLWQEAHICGRDGNVYQTEQTVGLGPIREQFRTRTTLNRPDSIDITSDDATFRRFDIRWDFADLGRRCRIAITLQWEMRSLPLQLAIELTLPQVGQMMIDAFAERARQTAAEMPTA
jgi:coenzyme Q-binding protein COQ10